MTEGSARVAVHPLGDPIDHYWLVQHMARSCDVDTVQATERGALTQADWAAMVQKCRSCQWTEGCQRWITQMSEKPHVDPPANCLNNAILKSLAGNQKKK